MAPRRIRQHVNPLSVSYIEPRAERIAIPASLGADARIEVELGCADARFAFELARAHPHWLVVGLDIREKVLARNRVRAAAQGLANLRFGYVNLNVDQDRVFSDGVVDRFHLLFPDPWFKSKHQKRRVMNDGLIRTLCQQLRAGGEIHVASDIFEIALDAMAELESDLARALGLRNLAEAGPWSFWRDNPFGAASRRERMTLAREQRVWRLRYGLVGV